MPLGLSAGEHLARFRRSLSEARDQIRSGAATRSCPALADRLLRAAEASATARAELVGGQIALDRQLVAEARAEVLDVDEGVRGLRRRLHARCLRK